MRLLKLKIIIKFRATGIRKIFRVVIYTRKKWCTVKCVRSARMGRKERHLKDKIFENITLCLDQQPLKIQFTKEKRTLKTLDLSPEAYSHLNVNRAVKNKLVLTKI